MPKNMTAKQLKEEIKNALDKVPENRLPDVLWYLQEVQESSSAEYFNAQHLKKSCKKTESSLRNSLSDYY